LFAGRAFAAGADRFGLEVSLPSLGYLSSAPVPLPRLDEPQDTVTLLRHPQATDPLAVRLQYAPQQPLASVVLTRCCVG